jgi:Xaa-Pro aminopeptidase
MKSNLDQIMQDNNVDALWVMGAMYNNPDMVYFTGIHHANQVDLFKIRGNEPLVYHFVDMEREEAKRSGLETHAYDEKFPLDFYLKNARGNVADALAFRLRDVFHEIGLVKGKVAISGWDNLGSALAIILRVRELLPGIEFFSFIQDSPIRQARMTKTPEEAEHIRKMGKLTIEVVGRTEEFLTTCHVNNDVLHDQTNQPVTIGKVKEKINLWLAELGADNPEETIFSIGRDAGIPHSTGNPQDVLRTGVPIVFDIFPREKGGGYFYDFTRTWCLGFAPQEVQTIYQQTLDVHHGIISVLKPNTLFKKYQDMTCDMFEQMGHATIRQQYSLSEGYTHSIGHGLGLDIHENPFSGVTASDQDILAAGSVFSIEPGLYYPSREIGVRIEDTVYLNPEGKFEIMAEYPYDLVLPIKK